jgi:hypothetical protein
MKVTVTKDNTATDYFFSPEHKAEVGTLRNTGLTRFRDSLLPLRMAPS